MMRWAVLWGRALKPPARRSISAAEGKPLVVGAAGALLVVAGAFPQADGDVGAQVAVLPGEGAGLDVVLYDRASWHCLAWRRLV